MNVDDLDHVVYLGCFVVAGKLYRGDLYRDNTGHYWAEHSLTNPDGSWMAARQSIYASNADDAATVALKGIMEYLALQGDDVSVMTIVHHAPAMNDMSDIESGVPVRVH